MQLYAFAAQLPPPRSRAGSAGGRWGGFCATASDALTTIALKDMRQTHPDRIIKAAVRGMLPKNVLGEEQFKKLKVYTGTDHPHTAQKPKDLAV